MCGRGYPLGVNSVMAMWSGRTHLLMIHAGAWRLLVARLMFRFSQIRLFQSQPLQTSLRFIGKVYGYEEIVLYI